ncbi:MAG TPA: hypothetical protein VGL56_16570 [Fimbriimonadaceae bacterium]|jgi:hypothetical protein
MLNVLPFIAVALPGQRWVQVAVLPKKYPYQIDCCDAVSRDFGKMGVDTYMVGDWDERSVSVRVAQLTVAARIIRKECLHFHVSYIDATKKYEQLLLKESRTSRRIRDEIRLKIVESRSGTSQRPLS